MKNIEYTKMAWLYDKFYTNKNYANEVNFLKQFINNENAKILDAGCGTGNHAKILADLGYNIHGFDISEEMVEVANSKVPNAFFVSDLLSIKRDEKYDMIISFFAVFNHLKNYKEFKIALTNLKELLNNNGKIMIDLHNPQKSGTKTDTIDNATRIMSWKKCNILNKEFTKIRYIVDGKTLNTSHIFKIFKPCKLKHIATELGFNKVEFYANYDINQKADSKSKNIQMLLSL